MLEKRTMRAKKMAAVIVAGIILAGVGALNAASPAVTNFRDGEVVRYPVVLLAGRTGDASASAVTVVNESSKRDTRRLAGLAGGGAFKALAELVPGDNRLLVRCGQAETKLTLVYKPAESEYLVRVFYWTDSTGATAFQSPDPNDSQDWRGKLDTAMKLLQCFTAERINDIGLGRRTFNLEFDDTGRVKVHLLRGAATAGEYRKMTGMELYAAAGAQLRVQQPSPTAKDLVIAAFTRFDGNAGRALAHTALGGRDLALFGGGNLFTWPDCLASAQAAFMDASPVDRAKFFSDSAGRDTYWACAATTMGAALHELGHVFGLVHSVDPQDIMTRGYDRLNRFFTLVEPPHSRRASEYAFAGGDIARWSPVSGGVLAALRVFEPDKRDWSKASRTTVKLDREGRRIDIASPDGLRYIAVNRTGKPYGVLAVRRVAVQAGATKASVALADLDRWVIRGLPGLVVIDGQGHVTSVTVRDLLQEQGER